MEAHNLFLTTIITISFFLIVLPESHCKEDEQYLACHRPFNCGTQKDIGYPFWTDDGHRYCGRDGFQLLCHENQFPSIQVGSQNFQVLDIDPRSYTMKMVRTDLAIDDCSSHLTNTSLSNLFRYDQNVKNVSLFYDCPSNISIGQNNFTCKKLPDKLVFYGDDTLLEQFSELHKCERHIQVSVSTDTLLDPEDDIEALERALRDGFGVRYTVDDSCGKCMDSGGFCGSNDKSQFTCHCVNGPHTADCSDSKGLTRKQKKVIVGVVSSSVTVIVMIVIFCIYQRRKKTSYAKSYIQSRAVSSNSSMMDTENGVHVFTYSELVEATNNFDSAKELGDGGFGTVYFGKLQDGRHVAVKRLYENNYKRVEQFINEVEILTRLRHTNLVSLYGCTSRHSHELLLVYEYIPNGTVADHLHGERAKPGSLPWSIRMNIAIETASALAYLHASEIIHRDVKTNNILLDNHFTVKVADFGLSRLFPENVTHISTVPQGTPGYVDPEYHECYQLTDKSDVYSFGVVLIELISSMLAVDITRHRHEINLATMAINKIQNRALHELVDPTLGFESDYKVRKMINAVAELAFQCLQNMKDMRPSMEEVLETLKDIESDGKHKSKPEVMDILADEAVLLKNDLPPLSPDSNFASKSTTPNASN